MIRNHDDHDRQRHFEWTLDSAEFGKALVRLQLILLAHTLDSDVQAARPFPNDPKRATCFPLRIRESYLGSIGNYM